MAILAAKMLAGVALEMNLRECISCMDAPRVNKAGYSGFETQTRCYQKSKQGYQWPNQKDLCPPIIYKKIYKKSKKCLVVLD